MNATGSPVLGGGSGLSAVEQMQKLLGRWVQRNVSSDVWKAMAEAAQPAVDELYTRLNKQLTDQLRPFFASERVQAFVEQLRAILPDNWRDLSAREIRAFRPLADAGYPICWVPRADVLGGLVRAANPRGWPGLLAERRSDILDDCLAALDRVAAHDDLVTAARDAAELLENDRSLAAQALATNVFDAALREAIPPIQVGGYYPRVVTAVGANPEQSIRQFRYAATFWPVIPAIARVQPGDPTPPGFNRHATAHRVDGVQYTPANALIALMLGTSILCEVTYEVAEEQQESDEPTR